MTQLGFTETELEKRFDRAEKLKLHILGMNGRERTVENVWKLFSLATAVRIPGTGVTVFKKSVSSGQCDGEGGDRVMWEWAVLLKEKNKQGQSECSVPNRCKANIIITDKISQSSMQPVSTAASVSSLTAP
jgi:hypothetical protein